MLDIALPLFAQAADAAPAAAEAATNLAEAAAAVAGKFSSADTIWVLLGAALVFFMHPGFTMVEAGFTRAKNTGNIVMKNVLTFAIGSLIFTLVGFGFMFGTPELGGSPYFGIFDFMANKAVADEYGADSYPGVVFLIFQTVFAATAVTIVSGAMAERTKFSTYCLFCLVMCGIIYPVSGHWVWGGGWIADQGFHDFAGSTVVHMVGGISALIGAALLGPRIGKYTADGKPRAILGSNLALGCLGVLILWFGWFGFNGASTVSATGDDTLHSMGHIFVTTNLAAASGTVVTMLITWLRYGKPDVSMTLNGALGGLVGITAGCDVISPIGAIVVGAVASVFLVLAIEFIDKVLHIDDPVGAIGVHGVCGIVGTLAVGLFADPKVNAEFTGTFYGGGVSLLTTQAVGIVAVAVWILVAVSVTFIILKSTVGLRVSAAEEVEGLDVTEHGLASAYADFNLMDQLRGIEAHDSHIVPVNVAVPVTAVPAPSPRPAKPVDPNSPKLSKIVIITRPNKFEELRIALSKINITGMTVTQVMGCGMQKGGTEFYRGIPVDIQLRPKVRIEIVVCKVPVQQVVDVAKKTLYTGQIVDGKIFIYDVENAIKVRTSEEGYDALQDE